MENIVSARLSDTKRADSNGSHSTQGFAEPFPPRDFVVLELVTGGEGSRSVYGIIFREAVAWEAGVGVGVAVGVAVGVGETAVLSIGGRPSPRRRFRGEAGLSGAESAVAEELM